jgi:hypothetical protein
MSQAPHPDAAPLSEVFCSSCGYNLRGLTADRCPECGSAIDFDHLISSEIPWAHRINRGRLRAYWQTVQSAVIHPTQFGEHVHRPMDYRDSQHFRWMTIAHVLAPLLAAAVSLYCLVQFGIVTNPMMHEVLVNVWPVATFLLAMFAFLLAATGVPSYFCHPHRLPIERQNRGIALSYYAAAPLGLSPLAILLALAGFLILETSTTSALQMLATGLITTTAFILIGQLIAWWLLTIAFVRRAADRTGSWMSGFNIALPALWLGLFVITFGLTTFTCLYLAAFVISLSVI